MHCSSLWAVCKSTERIIELLTMHHLIQVFEHYDDEETAIASFAS